MTPMAKNFNQQFRRELQRVAPKDIQERIKFYEQCLRERREARMAKATNSNQQEDIGCQR